MNTDTALTVILLLFAIISAGMMWAADQRRQAYTAMRDRLQQRSDQIWQEGFRRGYARGYDEGMRTAHPGAEQISIQQVPLRPDGTADSVRLAEMIAEQMASATEPQPGPLPGSRLHGNPRVN